MAHANWEAIDALAKDWAAQKFNAERQIDRLQERISVLKNEVEQILMERIRDKAHADIYDVMLQKRDEAIQSAEQQINEYRDAQASLEARKRVDAARHRSAGRHHFRKQRQRRASADVRQQSLSA